MSYLNAISPVPMSHLSQKPECLYSRKTWRSPQVTYNPLSNYCKIPSKSVLKFSVIWKIQNFFSASPLGLARKKYSLYPTILEKKVLCTGVMLRRFMDHMTVSLRPHGLRLNLQQLSNSSHQSHPQAIWCSYFKRTMVMHLSVSIDASDAFQFLFCLSFLFFFWPIRGNMQHDINKSNAFNFLLQLEIFSK